MCRRDQVLLSQLEGQLLIATLEKIWVELRQIRMSIEKAVETVENKNGGF